MSTSTELVAAARSAALEAREMGRACSEPVDLHPAGEPQVERFYERRCVVLEGSLRQKDDLLADAVVCLHEAGDHENADRIERLGAPW